jgi:hypothetical protein
MATPDSTSRRRVRSEWHKYKTSFTTNASAQLPHGWKMEDYDRQHHPHDFYPPGGEPKNVFSHELSPQHGFKYPAPVLNWADTPSLSDQTQYLWCETGRAHLVVSKTTILRAEDYERRIHFVEGNSTILSITMPDMASVEEMMDEKKRPGALELVAFARGWSTWLGYDIERGDDEGSTSLQKFYLRI